MGAAPTRGRGEPSSIAQNSRASCLLEVLDYGTGRPDPRGFFRTCSTICAGRMIFSARSGPQGKAFAGGRNGQLAHARFAQPGRGHSLSADLIKMNHSDEETVHCCNGIRLHAHRSDGHGGRTLEFSRGETKLDLARTDTGAFLQQFSPSNEELFSQHRDQVQLEADPAPIVSIRCGCCAFCKI